METQGKKQTIQLPDLNNSISEITEKVVKMKMAYDMSLSIIDQLQKENLELQKKISELSKSKE